MFLTMLADMSYKVLILQCHRGNNIKLRNAIKYFKCLDFML